MKILEGAIYTVDDVSDLLGIPRPTLYRYLREYSIPHLRQGGRIRIPEDSFDRIREARDLHKEGLGTESVRRQIREGGPDANELDRRLNGLHETLEDLRDDLKSKPSTGEVALSPALRTILARQSLMLSAMFNLTGMVEDLLLTNGRSRKRPVQRYEDAAAGPAAIATQERGQLTGTVVEHVPVRYTEPSPAPSPATRAGFGSLARRRRRGAVAVFSVLLLGLFLVFLIPTMDGDETASGERPAGEADRREPPEERPAGAEGGDDDSDPGGNAGEGKGDSNNVAAETGATASEDPESPGGTPTGGEADPAPDGGIPDVSGRPLEDAADALREAGYEVAAIQIRQSSEEPGTVIGTEPGPGTDAPSNSPVVLTASSGPTGTASASASSASAASASTSSASTSSASTSSAGASAAASSSASASASPSP